MPVSTATLQGIDMVPRSIAIELLRRLPSLVLVGLPASSAREVASVVRSAIEASGFTVPRQRVVASVGPADVEGRLQGQATPLAIAVAILAATGQIESPPADFVFLGDLSLSGDVRPTRGAVAAARRPGITLVTGRESAAVVAAAELPVRALTSLGDLRAGFGEPMTLSRLPAAAAPTVAASDLPRPEREVLEAMADAATTRRPVVLVGPHGTGKTKIGARAHTLLPRLSEEEALTLLQIQDVAGLLREPTRLADVRRPFRAPHHTISLAGLVGNSWGPGECTLAHEGVLFLDEFSEFSRATREALHAVIVQRAVLGRLPANVWPILTVTPCPCGSPRSCACTPTQIEQHSSRWRNDPLVKGGSGSPPALVLNSPAPVSEKKRTLMDLI